MATGARTTLASELQCPRAYGAGTRRGPWASGGMTMRLSQVDWGTVGRAAIEDYTADDVPGLAAEMAFWTAFSIDRIVQPIPDSAAGLRQPLAEVLQQQGGGALSLGALFALYSASNGVVTMMKAFNRVYGIEETRTFVVRKLLAIGLTAVLSLLLIGGFLLLLAGGKLADLFHLGTVGVVLLLVGRLAGAALGIALALALLYWKGPNIAQTFVFISPGSLVATTVWLVLTAGFGLYMRLIGDSAYARYYGAAAGLILFLLYLYLTSTVMVLGAALNAEAGKRYDPATIRDKLTNPRKQRPGAQPAVDPRAAREAGTTPRQVMAANAGGTPAPPSAVAAAVDGRLAALRRRPPAAAAARARARREARPPAVRARAGRRTLAVLAAAVATALGGVLAGLRRR